MRVLLIDDHALVRKGLEELLRSRGVEVVASCGNGADGVKGALAEQPDVVLLDLNMPHMNGIEALETLRAQGFLRPVLMLTMSRDDSDLQAALRAGADGYLLKDMDPEDFLPTLEAAMRGAKVVSQDLVGALARLVQGHQPVAPAAPPLAQPAFADLTPREQEILRHLADGSSNKAIGRALSITDGTVKLHVKAILKKLGLHSRVEAAVLAVEHGFARKRG